jgi:hypothetical protein
MFKASKLEILNACTIFETPIRIVEWWDVAARKGGASQKKKRCLILADNSDSSDMTLTLKMALNSLCLSVWSNKLEC